MIYLFVNLKEPFVNPSKTNNQCRQNRSCSPPSCARLCRFALQRTLPPHSHDGSTDYRISRICSLPHSYFVYKITKSIYISLIKNHIFNFHPFFICHLREISHKTLFYLMLPPYINYFRPSGVR